jgi:SOS-response transcriptional repressor LexA
MAGAEDRLLKELGAEGGVTPFVGSGLSLAVTGNESCAGWRGLLDTGLDACESAIPTLPEGWGSRMRTKLEMADLDDYIAIGTEISNRLKGVGEGRNFDTWIENTVGKLSATKEGERYIDAVRRLGSVIVTTNYDSLIEALEPKWTAYDWEDKGFAAAVRDSRVVLHLHGSANKPSSVVLGSGEYQRLETELNAVLTRSLFVSHTLVFIGCGDGLSDPHITPVLRFMSRVLTEEDVEHFLLLTKEEHRNYSKNPISTRLTAIPYGSGYGELLPYLQKLAGSREKAVTTEPEAVEQSVPAEEGAGLLFVAVTAEQKLKTALDGLDTVREALQQVESSSAISGSMAEWEPMARIREHQRLVTMLRKPAADLSARAERVISLVNDAFTSTWQLTHPDYADEASKLPEIVTAISALETASGQLVVRITRAHDNLVSRINVYNGYEGPSDRLSRAHAAVSKAHTRAISLREAIGLSQTRQEPRWERPAPQVALAPDTEPPTADVEPASPPALSLAPMLGQATAGSPTGVGQPGEEQIPVPPQYSRRSDVFAVKVVGNSMAAYGILNGDYVTMLPQGNYLDGDIVVAIFGGESSDRAVVKVLRRPERGEPYLEPLDPSEVEKEGFTVQGKVAGLVRWQIEHVPQRRGRSARQSSAGAKDAGQPTLD